MSYQMPESIAMSEQDICKHVDSLYSMLKQNEAVAKKLRYFAQGRQQKKLDEAIESFQVALQKFKAIKNSLEEQ